MKTQHAPGPWRIWRDMDPKEPIQIAAPSDDFVCTMERINTNHDANARLIAAAPDLLAALQLMLTSFETHFPHGIEVTAARAAIAKATQSEIVNHKS